MVKHLTIRVSGRVQDVGFRYHTKQTADRLGISGIVQNQVDGMVVIEVEGTEEQLQKFLVWCHDGPSAANVDSLEHRTGEVEGYTEFEIID